TILRSRGRCSPGGLNPIIASICRCLKQEYYSAGLLLALPGQEQDEGPQGCASCLKTPHPYPDPRLTEDTGAFLRLHFLRLEGRNDFLAKPLELLHHYLLWCTHTRTGVQYVQTRILLLQGLHVLDASLRWAAVPIPGLHGILKGWHMGRSPAAAPIN